MPAKAGKSVDKSSVVSELREGRNNIYYEKSVTKNLGNYESAKVTVGVTLPIQPTDEEVALIKKTLEIGDEIVTKELEIQLKELIDDK
nr:MAG TPA: hypothetical protein [Caudoviricetes sp.]